jgi:hypothetical protein
VTIIALFGSAAPSQTTAPQAAPRVAQTGGKQQIDDPHKIPTFECTVSNVLAAEKLRMNALGIQSMQDRLAQTAALRKIALRAKDDRKPLAEQLSKSDLQAFNETNARLAAGMASDVVDSGHMRDLDVIGKLVAIADRLYQSSDLSLHGEEDQTMAAVIAFERDQAKKNGWNTNGPISTDGRCSLGYALNKRGEAALLPIDQQKVDNHAAELAALKSKYGSDYPRAMSAEDQTRYNEISAELQAAFRADDYYHDLMNINALAEAADLKYRIMKSDLARNGGNYATAGDGLDVMQKNGEISARELDALNVLHVIADKMPSDWVKERTKSK